MVLGKNGQLGASVVPKQLALVVEEPSRLVGACDEPGEPSKGWFSWSEFWEHKGSLVIQGKGVLFPDMVQDFSVDLEKHLRCTWFWYERGSAIWMKTGQVKPV